MPYEVVLKPIRDSSQLSHEDVFQKFMNNEDFVIHTALYASVANRSYIEKSIYALKIVIQFDEDKRPKEDLFIAPGKNGWEIKNGEE